MIDHVGQQLGNYRLLRLLGRGGFAGVYLGEHIYLKSHAALKLLNTLLTDQQQDAFLKEAQMLVQLSHSHIVRVLDFAVQDDVPFLVMEYASNGTLRQCHPRGSRLPFETIISYIWQVASALQYAHDQYLIHRDVKPENMLLDDRSNILLSDFGLAVFAPHSQEYSTHVMAEQVAGTSRYLAPEQLQGRPQRASDQYALGVVVYEWLSGTPPFEGTSIEIAMQHLSMPPPSLRQQVPDLSPAVEMVVLRALEKDPDKRFPHVQNFATALEQALQGANVTSPDLTPFSLSIDGEMLQMAVKPEPLWNVPAPFTSLVGREQDVAAIADLLRSQQVRLLTLVGIGGIGKTRLALQVAGEIRTFFTDGVCFVPLAAVSDPERIPNTIAETLNIPEVGTQSTIEKVRFVLRDKHLLLILDNFEQVVEAAPLVEDLLIACPKLKAIVTSRAVLHLQAEHEFPMSSLALPDLSQLPTYEDLAHYSAVALFVQRAKAVLPSFQLTPANASTVAEICVRLDGLPLAIELAAARIRILPPQALLARLSQRLAVLTGGARTLPTRHQTLRNTLKWSYDLLDEAGQRLFRRLSIFVGGWTLDAVEAVCYDTPQEATVALDEVASLLDKSLLLQLVNEGAEPRMQMLMTVREYGLECLQASGETEATGRAHAQYYVALAEKAEKELGGSQQEVCLEQLEREHENLRAALSWFLERGEAESVLRLCGAIWWFWSVRGHISEGRYWLESALARGEGVAATVRAKALNGAGMLALNQDDYDAGEALCEEALALFRELGDKQGMAMALYRLGLVACWKCNYTAARSLQVEALALYREMGDKGGAADPMLTLSNIAHDQGNYAEAYSMAKVSIALFGEVGDKWGLAYAYHHLARVIFAQGNVARARATLEKCLALSKELGYREGIADSLAIMGEFTLHQGDAAMAHSLLEESLLLFREVGDRRGVAKALCLLAKVIAVQGDNTRARAFYEESMVILRALGYKEYIAFCLEGLGAAVATQTAVWAVHLWGAARALREAVGLAMPRVYRADYERMLAAMRSRLGEKAFATAWDEGRSMTPEQVLVEHKLV